MPDLACAFGRLIPEQQPSAGGKGGTLSRLYQAGYPVPDGFVVLPSAFSGDEILPEAWSQVQACLARLRSHDPNAPFAVRSSAVAEDSALASFAGAFETVLNIRSDEEVMTAINTVRQSRHSERVKAYSQAQGVPLVHEMAVIVQCLVKADISGVLFTADPVTSSRSRLVGNYVHGLGDKLVSGEVESIDFSMERPKCRYNAPSEIKRFSRKLYKLASRLEKDLGCPQDIEWAISQGKVYILQSRPITTMIGFNPVTGEFNDSLTGDFIWSCVNSGEAMPNVMTPFTWSTFSRTYNELNILPGYDTMGNIGGRCYQNSTVMVTLLRARKSNVKDMIKELGGVREEYANELDKVLIPIPGINLFSILPGSLRMLRKIRTATKDLKTFISENPGWCRAQCQRINETQNNEELVTIFMNELMPHVLDAFWITIATAWRHAGLTGKLRRQLTEIVDTIDADALLSNVSSADELLSSLGPVMGLSKVARG